MKMKMKRVLSKSLIVVIGLGFVACGGGSASSGESGFSFPSNAVEAEPTIENGNKVKEVVAQNQSSSYSINSVNSSESSNIAFVLSDITNFVKETSSFDDIYALNETIDETENCDNGGTVRISGSGSETNGGTVIETYNNCSLDGILIDGSIEGTIYNYNLEHDEFQNINVKFLTDTSVEINGLSSKIYSGSSVNSEVLSFSTYDETESMKMTISAISEFNGNKSGQNNAMYYFNNLGTSTPSMYQTQGKIYIDNLTSFVDYDSSYDMSQTPFVFNYSGLSSGEGRYIMANGGKVKIVAESNEAKTYVDADGDGTFELSE